MPLALHAAAAATASYSCCSRPPQHIDIDVLIGRISPAGRLPFSWPTLATDVPPEANYTMHGRTYRYGQRNVHWAFGFGRSFSAFEYAAATLSASRVSTGACPRVNVSVQVQFDSIISII